MMAQNESAVEFFEANDRAREVMPGLLESRQVALRNLEAAKRALANVDDTIQRTMADVIVNADPNHPFMQMEMGNGAVVYWLPESL